jgi:hypothetical protein
MYFVFLDPAVAVISITFDMCFPIERPCGNKVLKHLMLCMDLDQGLLHTGCYGVLCVGFFSDITWVEPSFEMSMSFI